MSDQTEERQGEKRLTSPLKVLEDVVSSVGLLVSLFTSLGSVVLVGLLGSVLLVEVLSVEVLLVEVGLSSHLCLRSIPVGAAEVNVARKAKKRRMATAAIDMERDIVTD